MIYTNTMSIMRKSYKVGIPPNLNLLYEVSEFDTILVYLGDAAEITQSELYISLRRGGDMLSYTFEHKVLNEYLKIKLESE